MEILWHQYDVTEMTPALQSQLIQEVQHNNLISDSKIRLDFSWGKGYLDKRWITIDIADDNPYQSYFLLKYTEHIIRSHSGKTVIFSTEHTRPAVSILDEDIS